MLVYQRVNHQVKLINCLLPPQQDISVESRPRSVDIGDAQPAAGNPVDKCDPFIGNKTKSQHNVNLKTWNLMEHH